MSLKSIKVIELAGLAPAPFCGMLLRDFGATVIRVDKLINYAGVDPLARGKQAIAIDLKKTEGQQLIKKMCSNADVLIDPFRPGILERFNLCPKSLLHDNEKLIVARLSGYGQTGPMASMAGHDINYLATSGLLSLFTPSDNNTHPVPPLNLFGDFAGGALLCALGICAALYERALTGKGKILDANITEGCSYLGTWIHRTRSKDYFLQPILWPNLDKKSANLLDGGAPFYSCYKTKDDQYMALGALEPQFWNNFIQLIDKSLSPEEKALIQFEPLDLKQSQDDLREKLKSLFELRNRDEWAKIFDQSDACCTPVLELDEIANHPQFIYRNAFDSVRKLPRPSPRSLSDDQSDWPDQSNDVNTIDEHTIQVLQEIGLNQKEIDQLAKMQVIAPLSKL